MHIYLGSKCFPSHQARYRAQIKSAQPRILIYIFTDGSYTKGTRAHTHRELIREWIWEPKGSSLENILYMYVSI